MDQRQEDYERWRNNTHIESSYIYTYPHASTVCHNPTTVRKLQRIVHRLNRKVTVDGFRHGHGYGRKRQCVRVKYRYVRTAV